MHICPYCEEECRCDGKKDFNPDWPGDSFCNHECDELEERLGGDPLQNWDEDDSWPQWGEAKC